MSPAPHPAVAPNRIRALSRIVAIERSLLKVFGAELEFLLGYSWFNLGLGDTYVTW